MSRKKFVIIVSICVAVAIVSVISVIYINNKYVKHVEFQESLEELAHSREIDPVQFEEFWSAQSGNKVEVYYNKDETMIMARYKNVTYTALLP